MPDDLQVRQPELDDLPYRLGRHVNHDPRSAGYAFRTAPPVPYPQVEWPRAVPVFDQGALGSCTGNAAAGWLAHANVLRPGLTTVPVSGATTGPALAPVAEPLAVEFYAEATHLDPFDGSYPPTDTGSDGLSVVKVLQRWGLVGVYQHAFDLPSVLGALQLGPVLIGTSWHRGMFTPDASGMVWPDGDVVGGHEYLLTGYRPDPASDDPASGTVMLVNSWGPAWGNDGYAVMTASVLGELLADHGDATIPHPVPVDAPTPPAAVDYTLSDANTAYVERVAARRDMTGDQWLNQHLDHYRADR